MICTYTSSSPPVVKHGYRLCKIQAELPPPANIRPLSPSSPCTQEWRNITVRAAEMAAAATAAAASARLASRAAKAASKGGAAAVQQPEAAPSPASPDSDGKPARATLFKSKNSPSSSSSPLPLSPPRPRWMHGSLRRSSLGQAARAAWWRASLGRSTGSVHTWFRSCAAWLVGGGW